MINPHHPQKPQGTDWFCKSGGGGVLTIQNQMHIKFRDSTLRGDKGRAVLPVRIFQSDLAVSKGEQVTTMNFDASAV